LAPPAVSSNRPDEPRFGLENKDFGVSKILRMQRHFLLRPAWFAAGVTAFLVLLVIDLAVTGRFSWLSKLTLAAVVLPPLGVLITVGVLKCETLFKYSFRRIRYTCPKCSTQALPLFRCPGCNQIVEDLEPSVFGVLRARCECGHPLPTTDWKGRLALTKVCPNPECNQDLHHDDLGHRSEYRIAMVGARSSGKTNLMITSVWQLEEQFAPKNRLAVSFGKSADESAYRASVAMLKGGLPMTQTVHHVPNALSLSLKPEEGHSSLLYVYDAAGESFQDEQRLADHPIDKYDGLMLVVDPWAEEGVQGGLAGDVDQAEIRAANPAPIEALEILGRLVTVLERVLDVPPGGVFPLPLAVVVTKADVNGIDQRFRIVADDLDRAFYNITRAADHAERHSRKVRSFLRQAGLGNLIGIVESRFGRVGYFAVSALRPPQTEGDPRGLPGRNGFRPHGVLAPLIWLCYYTDALSDTDLFDRTFMNWHVYVSRCLKGREGVRAQIITWTLLSAFALLVATIFMTVDWMTIMLCGGVHFIALVVLYICLYVVLVCGRFST